MTKGQFNALCVVVLVAGVMTMLSIKWSTDRLVAALDRQTQKCMLEDR